MSNVVVVGIKMYGYLTAWSRFLFEKLIVAQLGKNLHPPPPFYEVKGFIVVFTSTRRSKPCVILRKMLHFKGLFAPVQPLSCTNFFSSFALQRNNDVSFVGLYAQHPLCLIVFPLVTTCDEFNEFVIPQPEGLRTSCSRGTLYFGKLK